MLFHLYNCLLALFILSTFLQFFSYRIFPSFYLAYEFLSSYYFSSVCLLFQTFLSTLSFFLYIHYPNFRFTSLPFILFDSLHIFGVFLFIFNICFLSFFFIFNSFYFFTIYCVSYSLFLC